MLLRSCGLLRPSLHLSAILRAGRKSAVQSAQFRALSGSDESSTTPNSYPDPRSHLPLASWDGGDRLLFKGKQEFTVASMFGAGCVNLLYWSYYISTCFFYQDVVVQGINLGGDPVWGYIGGVGTVLIFFVNHQYSHHAVRNMYETSDGRRLGFQMYTMFGGPGRKIEASIGNVRYSRVTEKSKKWGSSLVPLRVEGVSRNVLIDTEGIYFDKTRLDDFLSIGERVYSSALAGGGVAGGLGARADDPTLVDSKERRVEFLKQSYQKRKTNKAKH